MPEHQDGPFRQAIRAPAGGDSAEDTQVRHAAWVARCVGRGATAPLLREDVAALAGTLAARRFDPGAVLFAAGNSSTGCGSSDTGRSNSRSAPGDAVPSWTWSGPATLTETFHSCWRCRWHTPRGRSASAPAFIWTVRRSKAC